MVAILTLDHRKRIPLKGWGIPFPESHTKLRKPIISTITLDLLIFQMRMEKVNQKLMMIFIPWDRIRQKIHFKQITSKRLPPQTSEGGKKFPSITTPQSKLPLFIKKALVNPLFLVVILFWWGVKFAWS